jgi:hypothetical protein
MDTRVKRMFRLINSRWTLVPPAILCSRVVKELKVATTNEGPAMGCGGQVPILAEVRLSKGWKVILLLECDFDCERNFRRGRTIF